jgi:Concanavalin A-like lectin/glucanases superfamily
MARNFLSASSQRGSVAQAILTAVPLTMCCWTRPVSIGANYSMMFIHDGSINNLFGLQMFSGNVLAWCESGGVGTNASSSTLATAGAWAHCAARFTSATSRDALLNGGGKGSDATNKTPGGLNAFCIGAQANGSPFLNGDLAECAMWNVALTDAEIAVLATGIASWFVRPDALVAYWPLVHGYSPEIELIGSRNLALVNAPAIAGHPPINYRSAAA